MNLQLANTEEFIDGQFTGNLGEVLIRWVGADQCGWMGGRGALSKSGEAGVARRLGF